MLERIPKKRGNKITVRTYLNIAKNETSTHFSAKKYTSVGVIIGARRVDVIVMATEKDTFTPAI